MNEWKSYGDENFAEYGGLLVRHNVPNNGSMPAIDAEIYGKERSYDVLEVITPNDTAEGVYKAFYWSNCYASDISKDEMAFLESLAGKDELSPVEAVLDEITCNGIDNEMQMATTYHEYDEGYMGIFPPEGHPAPELMPYGALGPGELAAWMKDLGCENGCKDIIEDLEKIQDESVLEPDEEER